MKKLVTVCISILALGVVLAGCSGGSSEDGTAPASSRGRIVSINAADNVVVLNHQEIPGVMMGMTMPFVVAEASLLEGLTVDDAVEFEIEQRNTGLTIVSMKKIDPSDLGALAGASYQGRAEVIATVPQTATIMVRATDIPGLSGEGSLVYSVNPPSLLDGIAEGDKVEIKLVDDGNAQGQLIVVELKKVN